MYACSVGKLYSSSACRTIVASWPGEGTGDTVYETATGHRIYTSASTMVPSGYTWDTGSTNTSTLHVTAFVRIEPEELPRKPKYVDPAPRPTKYIPKVRTNFRVTQRPEFHARSNPR